jgi:hypothetical protein
MKNYFLSTNHHPSTHSPWVAGQVLVNSAGPVGVWTDTPAGWPWQGIGCKPSPGHPEPTREVCSLTSSPVERSQIPRLAGFVLPWPNYLEGRKEGSTAIKREGESAAAQTSIALSSILLNWPLRNSSSVVPSSSSSFSPAGADGSLPCLQSSLRSHLWSRAISHIFFFYLQPLLV